MIVRTVRSDQDPQPVGRCLSLEQELAEAADLLRRCEVMIPAHFPTAPFAKLVRDIHNFLADRPE